MAGYSGTPLAKKLDLKDGQRVWWQGAPASVREEIAAAGLSLVELTAPEAPIDVAHVFVTRLDALDAAIVQLRPLLSPGGFIWVSWPKKSARVATDVTEDEVRRVVLPTGLVDIKVCAVDQTWSGLKLMIRRALR